MLLFAEKSSPRLSYITDLIRDEILIQPCVITQDSTVFLHYEGPRINYSNLTFEGIMINISPSGLLFEDGISKQELGFSNQGGIKRIFPQERGDMGFDLLSAIFYLVTRYEEYLFKEEDIYGRFNFKASIAYKEGFLHEPLINTWLEELQDLLQAIYPEQVFRRRSFQFLPTYDIDMMYSYLYKGWKRNVGGTIRSILNGKKEQASQRVRVLQGKERDPYDAYEWLDALHLYCRVKPIYFFLVAQQQEGYDKNISTDVKAFQELINYYAKAFEVGLHPSWKSSTSGSLKVLSEEKEWLEVISDREINKSRQHYLKFSLPKGYRNLLEVGIKEDYSMGYGNVNGFRASICTPFYWFDLEKNESTDLRVFPFCFMDANSYYELKQSPQEAYNELMRLYAAVKKVKGCFITIWHNSFLGTAAEFRGWREVYEVFMKEDAYWDAG
jgi:hypothetical protein